MVSKCVICGVNLAIVFRKDRLKGSEESISIEIERENSLQSLILIPQNIDGKGTIGAQLQPNIKKETKKTKNLNELFQYTNKEFSSLLIKTIQGYKGLITNFSSTAQQLSGPVKIVEIGAPITAPATAPMPTIV